MRWLIALTVAFGIFAAGCGGPSADGEIDPRTLKAPEIPPGMENQTGSAAAAPSRQPMAGATPTPAGEPPANR
ncbi:MAG: hypothetical protein SNJ74_02675 [Fimbriimonadaceae bacterium]